MKATDIPARFQAVWGYDAAAGTTRPIPVAPSGETGAASLQFGFPVETMQPVGAGGVPPFGQDFNGIFTPIVGWAQWLGAGGPVGYDATFSTAIGGYPKGALLAKSGITGSLWQSTAEDNTTNPDASGAGWISFPGGRQPTQTKLTSGSGTYTTPAGVVRIAVRQVGAGGGGGSSGTTVGNAGGVGGNTTFGTVTANGGAGGQPGTTNPTAGLIIGGAGGAAGTSGTGTASLRLTGGNGAAGGTCPNNGSGAQSGGGAGGGAPFFAGFGAGGNTYSAIAGNAAPANSGGGGGGGGPPPIAGYSSSGGGGPGEYVEIQIANPAASYTYSVGAGGTGATAGTNGFAGGNGGSGVILIDEYYS